MLNSVKSDLVNSVNPASQIMPSAADVEQSSLVWPTFDRINIFIS